MENSLNSESINNKKEQDEISKTLKITIGQKRSEEEKEKDKEFKTIINNIKLTYDESGIYEEVPIKTLIDETRKPTKILRKIALINCNNDTSEIDFYENKQQINNKKIIYASDYFIDNILLYTIAEQDENNIKLSKNCAYGNNIIKGWLHMNGLEPYKEFLLKAKRVEKGISEDEYLNYKRINNKEIDKNKLCKQIYKIALSNTDINKILSIFNKGNLKHLENQHAVYFYDLDSTKDICGCINKEKLIIHLLEKDNFHLEKKFSAQLEEDEVIIIDNDYNVGRHCLTMLYCINNDGERSEVIRMKLYNKFINHLELKG